MGGEGVEWQTEVASKLVDKGKEEVDKIKDYSKSRNLCL